jgi:polyferredoxin
MRSIWLTCICMKRTPTGSTNASSCIPRMRCLEAPARGVSYTGRESIKANYLKLFASAEGVRFEPIERFASPDRVFDDMWVYFTLAGDGFENCPFPKGTKVRMRLLHNFHIRDGMIAREIGYEVWLRDE